MKYIKPLNLFKKLAISGFLVIFLLSGFLIIQAGSAVVTSPSPRINIMHEGDDSDPEETIDEVEPETQEQTDDSELAQENPSGGLLKNPLKIMDFVNEILSDDSDTGWTWNQSTKTLTLNSLDLTDPDDSGINLPGGSTIILNGKSKLRSGINITAYGDLLIKGSGSLTVGNVPASEDADLSRISAFDGDLTIESGTINLNHCDMTYENKFLMKGGTINADQNCYIAAFDVTVNEGKINLKTKCYLVSYGDMTINGGSIISYEPYSPDYPSSSVIDSENLYINGGKIDLTNYNMDEVGVIKANKIVITAGTITVDTDGCGMKVSDSIVIDGGKLAIKSGFYGLLADKITINGGSGTINNTKSGGNSGNNPAVLAASLAIGAVVTVKGYKGSSYTVPAKIGKMPDNKETFYNQNNDDDALRNIKFTTGNQDQGNPATGDVNTTLIWVFLLASGLLLIYSRKKAFRRYC